MGKPRLDQLDSTHFRCPDGHEFEASPDRVEDKPEWDWHPFEYFCKCPECDQVAEQHSRYRGLLKAHARATGPKTTEGKAMSAANLKGHPTPEEALKTRFNAVTHGQDAKVANYYPAKPGKYPRCEHCDYYGNDCIEKPPANHKNPLACLSKVELFMQHTMAFESGDAGMLTGMRANMQAGISSIMDDIILAIAQRGVEIVTPQWKVNPQTGGVVIAKYLNGETEKMVTIEDVRANPLLKTLMEIITKNNLSLQDMNMTLKVQSDNEFMGGYLEEEKGKSESSGDFQKKMIAQHDLLMDLIGNSYSNDAKVINGEVIDNG